MDSAEERTVWLIEGAAAYWNGHAPDGFGRNRADAVQFASQQDAERVLHWVVPEAMRVLCRTAEHFMTAKSPAYAPMNP